MTGRVAIPEPGDLNDRDLLRMAREQHALLVELRDEVERRGPDDPNLALAFEAAKITREIRDRLWSELRIRATAYQSLREALGEA